MNYAGKARDHPLPMMLALPQQPDEPPTETLPTSQPASSVTPGDAPVLLVGDVPNIFRAARRWSPWPLGQSQVDASPAQRMASLRLQRMMARKEDKASKVRSVRCTKVAGKDDRATLTLAALYQHLSPLPRLGWLLGPLSPQAPDLELIPGLTACHRSRARFSAPRLTSTKLPSRRSASSRRAL